MTDSQVALDDAWLFKEKEKSVQIRVEGTLAESEREQAPKQDRTPRRRGGEGNLPSRGEEMRMGEERGRGRQRVCRRKNYCPTKKEKGEQGCSKQLPRKRQKGGEQNATIK